MQKHVLNYRIFLEKEKVEGEKNHYIYTAYCPALGLNDFGKTIDEAVDRMTELITFHIESLAELQQPVPVEKDTTTVITSISVPVFPHARLSFI